MSRFPRYTTFKCGELEQALSHLTKKGAWPYSPPRRGRSPILRELTCTVTFPDRREGKCTYDRRALNWHLFRYQYCDDVWMPYVNWSVRFEGSEEEIRVKAQELAADSYRLAILREKKDYFQRASEPSDGSRKRAPHKYQLSSAAARANAGYYAVCKPLSGGGAYILSPRLYKDIETANEEWRERGDTRLQVLCCNRLDRCWELPRYNTLYAEHDPREGLPPLSPIKEVVTTEETPKKRSRQNLSASEDVNDAASEEAE
jgi:hypothetical protein